MRGSLRLIADRCGLQLIDLADSEGVDLPTGSRRRNSMVVVIRSYCSSSTRSHSSLKKDITASQFSSPGTRPCSRPFHGIFGLPNSIVEIPGYYPHRCHQIWAQVLNLEYPYKPLIFIGLEILHPEKYVSEDRLHFHSSP
jgi:hypothetical protein